MNVADRLRERLEAKLETIPHIIWNVFWISHFIANTESDIGCIIVLNDGKS